jgi:hypothetical protein
MLKEWDTQNRAENPRPLGQVMDTSLPPPALAQDALPLPPGVAQGGPEQPSIWAGAPALPAPTVLPGDGPAVRHAPPPNTPGALRPSSGPAAPAAQQTPPGAPVAQPASNEFGPWVSTKSAVPGPIVGAAPGAGTAPNGAPGTSGLRPPVVIVAVGEVDDNGKPVPAIAVVPVEAQPVLQPEKLPDPKPLPAPAPAQPDPKGADPKQPDPKQPDPKARDFSKVDGPVGSSATQGLTGDPNLDPLTVLDSKLVPYRIKLEQALLLAVINAREFQDRREDVYNAALQVTLNRFSFAAQGLFAEQALRRSVGSELTGAGQFWNLNTTAGVNRLFPTGAQLMAQLANQVVFDLGSGKPTVGISNLTLSAIQPFLKGGGYAVTLEPLTQSERNMVYALRSFERFRRLFYVSVSAGSPNGYTNNPYGLQGLSLNLGRGIGNNLTSPSVGFLPLLNQQAIILNQRKNVAYLDRLLRNYKAFAEGGQYSDLQVGQVEVQLLNSRAALLGSPASTNNSTTGIRGYLDTLDNFKLQLGLPLTVPLELDDAPMRPLHRQLGKFEEVYAQVDEVDTAAKKFDRTEPVAAFRKRWQTLFTTSKLVQGTPFLKNINERWGSWAPGKLTDQQVRDRLSKLREDRRKLLDERAERELKKVPEPPAEIARLAALEADIDLGEFELRTREYEAQPWAKLPGKAREPAQNTAFSAMYYAFYLVILEARNDRLDLVHRNWPQLAPLELTGGLDVLEVSLDDGYTAAIQNALTNRFDLMNARAIVVDAWRQIAVTANALQGVFNVEYDLNSTTPGKENKPFGFSGPRSTNQLVFNLQLPLVRRAERNVYRSTLINYQAARRLLIAFEDNIANDVRGDVRELRTLAQLYRIQQRVVEVQYAQVDNATAVLFAPPAPQPIGTANATDQGTAAALTQQVLTAQNNLVTAQNTLYQLWVAYMTSRMTFYLDLERLQLDDRGVWIDEFTKRIQRDDQPDARQPAGERLHAPRPVDGDERKIP